MIRVQRLYRELYIGLGRGYAVIFFGQPWAVCFGIRRKVS